MANGAVESQRKLFRTPLSCALLTGALTVAIYEFFRLAIWPGTQRHYLAVFFIESYLTAAMQLQGPVLLNHKNANMIRALVMALTLALVAFVGLFFFPVQWFTSSSLSVSGLMRGAAIRNTAVFTVHASLLGIFLARLYRVRKLYGLCSVLGILAVVPSLIYSDAQMLHSGIGNPIYQDSVEIAAMGQMLSYITTIAVVVLPTIPIDRELRRQEARRRYENAPREAGRT